MLPQHPDDGGIGHFILRQVLHNIRCGACGARYGSADVSVVESREGIWTLVAICPGCETQATILVVVQERNAEEGDVALLSADDVLDFHVSVGGFRGDLRQMLGTDDRERR